MEISFKKIAKEGSDFALKSQNVSFCGRVFLKSPTMALLKGKISGNIEHSCDRCAADMILEMDETIEIMVSDGIYRGEIDALDVVEAQSGVINFDEILQSEIESFKSDYHYCDQCKSH